MIEPGAPIAVVAPCGAYDPVRFAAGLEIARAHGLNPVPLPDNLQPWRYLAGTDAHRLEQLQAALTSPEFAAVWIARGGYGLTRIIEQLPWDSLQAKPIIGFSDVTALFNMAYARGIGPCVHGPVVHSLPISDDASVRALVDTLAGTPHALEGEVWVDGEVTAPVIGGNLCLVAATAGTPAQLDATGHILVLEEIGEPAYRIDRMVQQLHSAGIFSGVQAVVLGEFKDCRVRASATWTLEDILRDHLTPLGVPVVAHAPVGHGSQNQAFVWGSRGTLSSGRLDLAGSSRLT